MSKKSFLTYFFHFDTCMSNNLTRIIQPNMFVAIINQIFYKMDKVFKYFGDFFTGLTALVITLLGLGVAVEILFGSWRDVWSNSY